MPTFAPPKGLLPTTGAMRRTADVDRTGAYLLGWYVTIYREVFYLAAEKL